MHAVLHVIVKIISIFPTHFPDNFLEEYFAEVLQVFAAFYFILLRHLFYVTCANGFSNQCNLVVNWKGGVQECYDSCFIK